MGRIYKPEYFDQNFLRFLQLRLYAVKNKDLDLITDVKQADNIIVTGLQLQSRTSCLKETLMETVNNSYGGLENIRTLPIWRSHIYFAVAIFNNRIQTSINKILQDLEEEDSAYIIDELVDNRKDQEFNKKELAKIYSKFTRKKFYDLACAFLHRIDKLDEKEVKELYHFILEHLIAKYNVHKGLTSIVRYSYLTVESIITNSFKSDRGPFIVMLDETKNPEALQLLYNIWGSIDDDMPVIVKSKAQIEPVSNCSSNATIPHNRKRNSGEADIDLAVKQHFSNQPSTKRSREQTQSPSQNKITNSKAQLKPQTLANNCSVLVTQQVVAFLNCEGKNKDFDERKSSFVESDDHPVRNAIQLSKKKQTTNGNKVDNTRSNNELASFGLNCTLLHDFGQLLSSQEFCDLQFIVGNNKKIFVAHIAVVASRSEYLREKIRQEKELIEISKSSDSSVRNLPKIEIKLKSADPEAFEDVLHYMYTDRIEVAKKINNLSSQEIVLLLMNVHRLARDFKVKGLEQLSVKFILENLNVNNILPGIKYADFHNLNAIKEECINFLVKSENFGQIIERPEFEALLEKPLIVQVMKKKHNLSNAPQTNFSLITGPTLKQDMKDFLDHTGQKFHDISLLVDGELFSAHRVILAARCKYFRKVFQSSKPKNNAFSIQETNPSSESFQSLLQYIYYGDVNCMTPENCLHFLEATEFYGFSNNHLLEIFKKNFDSLVSLKNVIQILKAFDSLCETDDLTVDIKNDLLNLVSEYSQKETQSLKLESLSKELLIELYKVSLQKIKEIKNNFLS